MYGRVFQSLGAMQTKLLSAKVDLLVKGIFNKRSSLVLYTGLVYDNNSLRFLVMNCLVLCRSLA